MSVFRAKPLRSSAVMMDALEHVSCTELGCVFSDGVSCLEFSMCQAEMPEQASSSNDGKMNSGTAADVPARSCQFCTCDFFLVMVGSAFPGGLQ